MMIGRNSSYDKSWREVKANMPSISVGMSVDSVNTLLGEPDSKTENLDGEIILSYQEYSVLAAHWVYDIHIKNDTVAKIVSYDW